MKFSKLAGFLVAIVVAGALGVKQAYATTVTFGVAGDFGTDSNFTSLISAAGANGLNFFLAAGDLSYSTDPNGWSTNVKNAGFNTTASPFMIVSGNHEDSTGDGSVVDQYTSSTNLPNKMSTVVLSPLYSGPSGTTGYGKEYYFDYPTTGTPLVRVIAVSPSMNFTNGGSYSYSTGNSHYNWLKNTMIQARNSGIAWVVVFAHEPCITVGVKGCEGGAEILNLASSKDAGRTLADLILFGHDHVYERSYQLSTGGTGCSAISGGSTNTSCIANTSSSMVKGAGTVQLIVGTGGKSQYTINASDSEAGYFAAWSGSNISKPTGNANTWGFVRITIVDNTLSGTFVRTSGANYADSFSIGSGSGPTITPNPTATPTPIRTPTPTPRTSTPTPTPIGGKPGDANGDGKVDGLDYVVWLNHYNQTIVGGPSVGDFNRSGKVDGIDYTIWLTNYGK